MAKNNTTSANAASSTRKAVKSGKLNMSEAQLQYLEKLLTILISFTTFGASITFGLIVSQNKEPADPSNLPVVQRLIAVSWALFVMGLLLASLATTVLFAYQHASSRRQADKCYVTLQNVIDSLEWKGSCSVWPVPLHPSVPSDGGVIVSSCCGYNVYSGSWNCSFGGYRGGFCRPSLVQHMVLGSGSRCGRTGDQE